MAAAAVDILGGPPLKAPSPQSRTWNGPYLGWSGREGEEVADPVTPGVTWVGGPRGGARVEGMTHVPAGAPNGGDLALAPHNLAFRQCSLQAIDEGLRRRQEVQAAPFKVVVEGQGGASPTVSPDVPYQLDDTWKHPLEEAGRDPERMRDLTFNDVVQSMLRSGKQGGVYCSPPEKWGHRQVVMDLLTAPWVFPWRSPLLPYCSSARKLYALALASNFKFRMPGLPGRTLDRAQFFDLVFVHLLPSFPDLSFNARFLTTTGLDDCSHVEIQVCGTHTGAPFGPFGWPPVPASGQRVALPQEFLRLRLHEMAVTGMAADPLPPGREHLGFPTGIYILLGGDLPGF